MRKAILILFLLLVNQAQSQYGQEGAILAAAEAVIRAVELDQLNKIADAQDKIIVYHAAIAVTTADIVRIEQEILNSQSNLKPWIQGLNSVIRVGRSAEYLTKVLTEISNILQEQPALLPLLTEPMIQIIADGAIIIADYAIAFKQSSTNLLNNQARIEVVNVAQDGLDYLILKSQKLLGTTRTLAALTAYEEIAGDTQYDTEEAISATEEVISTFVKD